MSIDFKLVRLIVAQQELRKNHNISVLADHFYVKDAPVRYTFTITTGIDNPRWTIHRFLSDVYDTPEEALREGIEKAKELINTIENGTTSGKSN